MPRCWRSPAPAITRPMASIACQPAGAFAMPTRASSTAPEASSSTMALTAIATVSASPPIGAHDSSSVQTP